jgi:hypothetical protein
VFSTLSQYTNLKIAKLKSMYSSYAYGLTALIDSKLGNEGSTECLNFLLDSSASHNVSDDVSFASLPLITIKT